jgi:hypothetical protein
MSLRFASIVSKKSSVKNLVLISKFFACSRTLFSKFLRVKSNILNTFFDRWFLNFVQQTNREKFDDESRIIRKIRRNFNFFFLAMTFFFSFEVCKYIRQTFFVCVVVYFSSFAFNRRYNVHTWIIFKKIRFEKQFVSRFFTISSRLSRFLCFV